MKKITSLLLSLLCSTLFLFARTPEQAAEVAQDFLSQISVSASSSKSAAAMQQPLALAYTQYQIDATTPAVYVFNTPADQGFVLISAADDARAVLGYSTVGNFDVNAAPANLKFFLQMYADELARLDAAPQQTHAKQALARAQFAAQQAGKYEAVAPILADVCWGQDEPFNSLCPTIESYKAPTGCAATAIGQIMYVHQYPTQGIGSNFYTTSTYGLNLSADFGQTTYDWANILPNYNNGYTAEQASAVALLLSHVGIACKMDYGPDESAANGKILLQSLIEHFGYDPAITTLPKDYMLEHDMMNQIHQELSLGRPIFFEGRTKSDAGHAFVCDGIDAQGYLHLNWGWDGHCNGYFALSAFNPYGQGTGGSADDEAYTEGLVAYTGIQPQQGGQGIPLITVSSIQRTSDDVIARHDPVNLTLSFFMNVGVSDAVGTISYYIYDKDNNLVATAAWTEFELPSNYYFNNPLSASAQIPNTLPQGDYYLEVGYTDTLGTIRPILARNKGVVRIPISLSDEAIYFGDNADAHYVPITEAQFIYNDGTNRWDLDLCSAGFWGSLPADNEQIIRCAIYSKSATSVVGTYVLDPTNSMQPGTIAADALYAVGYNQSCSQVVPSDLHITITMDDNAQLQVQYCVRIVDILYQQTASINNTLWAINYNNQLYYYDSYITNELAATLPASKACALAAIKPTTEPTAMQYFVQGVISNVHSTSEQIAHYKSAHFSIVSEDQPDQPLYCSNTRWLNNTDFQTGKEIAPGDAVVLLGTLQYIPTGASELQGYIYSIESSDTDLQEPLSPQLQPTKLLQNGQILIRRDDKVYNILGAAL